MPQPSLDDLLDQAATPAAAPPAPAKAAQPDPLDAMLDAAAMPMPAAPAPPATDPQTGIKLPGAAPLPLASRDLVTRPDQQYYSDGGKGQVMQGRVPVPTSPQQAADAQGRAQLGTDLRKDINQNPVLSYVLKNGAPDYKGELTSLGTAIGFEGAGAVAGTLDSVAAKRALGALKTGIGGFFAYQIGKGGAGDVQSAYSDFQRGDYSTMAQHLGTGGMQLLGAFLGVRHMDPLGAIDSALESHNAEAGRLVEQDRNQGLGQEKAAGIVGDQGIPVSINGQPHTITARTGDPSGRPIYQVQDASGKTIHIGTGAGVQEFLTQRGASQPGQPAPPRPGRTADDFMTDQDRADEDALRNVPQPPERSLVETDDILWSKLEPRLNALPDIPENATPQQIVSIAKQHGFSAQDVAELQQHFGIKSARYTENQPTGPKAQATQPRGAAARPEVPETGIDEGVARGQDARERLAQQYAGKPWDQLTNTERNAIDGWIAEGHGFAVQPPAPAAAPVNTPAIPPPATPGMAEQRSLDQALDRAAQPAAPGDAAAPEAKAAPIVERQDFPDVRIPPEYLGKTVTVKTAAGYSTPVQYAMVPRQWLTGSHDRFGQPNPRFMALNPDLQPRDRDSAASVAQVNDLRETLDPDRLKESQMASEGAPIANAKLFLEAGNGRFNAINSLYEDRHPNAANYKQSIEADAAKFGIKGTFQPDDDPVLVRIRTTLPAGISPEQFALDANEPTVAGMSEPEQAKVDARRLTPEMLAKFVPNDEGKIATTENQDFIRDFSDQIVGKSARNKFMADDGTLSKTGETRIRNAVFHAAYRDSETLSNLSENLDPGIKNVLSGMLRAAPHFAVLRQEIQAGNRFDRNIAPDVAAAARKLGHLRRQGMTVEHYFKQVGLFGRDLSPLQMDVLQLFDDHGRSAKRIGDVLQEFVRAVNEAGDPKQGSMFALPSELEPPTPAEILDAAIEHVKEVHGAKEKEQPADVQKQPDVQPGEPHPVADRVKRPAKTGTARKAGAEPHPVSAGNGQSDGAEKPEPNSAGQGNDLGNPPEIGPFGPVFRQFHHDATGAINHLLKEQTGEAIGALNVPDVGDVDLIWKAGEKGIFRLALHRKAVLDHLQEIADQAEIVSRSANRIILESSDHKLVIRLDYDGTPKRWLLTAYEVGKPSSAGRRTDIPSGPERPVGQDDTAPPPQDGDSSNSTSIDQNPLDAQADPDADRAKLKADEDAARIAYQPARTLDAGKESIEDSPLFGGPRQGDMFAEEDPTASTAPQPMSTLAGAARRNQRRITSVAPPRSTFDKVTLGAATFAKTDVLPTVGNAAAAIVEASDDILKVLAPTMRSNDAKLGALVLRARLGELARKYDTAEHALRLAWKMFEKQKAADNYAFIHRIETGRPQPTPELQKIADLFRTMLDERRGDVQALGTGKLQKFYEDYFPHIWEKFKSAQQVFTSFLGRKPLEGGKSFLKQRTMPTFQDGLDAGLKPISSNPVDLVLLKVREMDRFVMAHSVLKEWKQDGRAKFIDARAGKSPAGWMKIDDPIGTVYGRSEIPISEYLNEGLYEGLEKLARDIGVKTERKEKLRGGALGIAYRHGLVQTKARTDEQTLAHEIGHQIEFQHHFIRQMLTHPDKKTRVALKRELRDLADMRYDGKTVTPYYAEYVRSQDEKAAAIVQAYVVAKDLFRKTAPTVLREFESFIDRTPSLDGLREIHANLQHTQIDSAVDAGGLVIQGHYWAPEELARVLNNHLAPGLHAKSGAFRALLGANNVLQQFQLGYSAFHLGFTSMDATTSKVALGIEQALRGKPLKAAASFAAAPAAPFTNYLKGSKVLREWYAPGSQGGAIAAIADAAEKAGARARMDDMYRTTMRKNMMRAFKEGNVWGGLIRAPFALTEAMAVPIMENIVPRQKLGVFADLASHELERLGPDATLERTREAMGAVWDSVDNRMGQLVYDNLFWDRTAKDLSMLMVRSVGWNVGTLREVGGGLLDTVRIPAKMAGGKPYADVDLHKLSYVLAMIATGAVFAAVYQYLHGAGLPRDWKDLVFPRTGRKTANGRDERVSAPSYEKDVFHYATEPLRTAEGKIAPMWNMLAEMLHNKDFYGDKIRNEDDPIVRQMLDEGKYLTKGFQPFGVRNMLDRRKEGAPLEQQAEQFFGITPAPKTLGQTPAERLASELSNKDQPEGGRTTQEAATREAERAIAQRIRAGLPAADLIREALRSGAVTPRGLNTAMAHARNPPLLNEFKRLTLHDGFRVWDAATPEERAELRPELYKKMAAAANLPDVQRIPLEAKFRAAVRAQ